MTYNVFTEYCTGCGLCKSASGVTFDINEKGFLRPNLNKDNFSLCAKICPASGYALKKYQNGTIWGNHIKSFLGWSNNEEIRKASSSGGILTTICLFLLEQRLVDGIIQTRKSSIDIRKTETIVSRTREDVLTCMGSRYTTSSPLMNLNELIKDGERYAFVGKPCDVSALRIYIEEVKPELRSNIIYLFSFFCAGQPSLFANNRLLASLGGENFNNCKDLQYRGDGWPGFATLTLKDGTSEQMDYETSWMKILGRDVLKICRFCADGTGELADISCGDAWYLDENGKPLFEERPGRNVIFARTKAGIDLLQQIVDSNKIHVDSFNPNAEGLHKMQPYHYTRKASLLVYKMALRLCGRIYPQYENDKLRVFAKGFPLKQKILRFGGTIQRIMKRAI